MSPDIQTPWTVGHLCSALQHLANMSALTWPLKGVHLLRNSMYSVHYLRAQTKLFILQRMCRFTSISNPCADVEGPSPAISHVQFSLLKNWRLIATPACAQIVSLVRRATSCEVMPRAWWFCTWSSKRRWKWGRRGERQLVTLCRSSWPCPQTSSWCCRSPFAWAPQVLRWSLCFSSRYRPSLADTSPCCTQRN